MTNPRPSLLDLHPVEALLALLLISVAALHRLFQGQVGAALAPAFAQLDPTLTEITRGYIGHINPCAIPANWLPRSQELPDITRKPTVADLRRMARVRGLSEAGGRPIHKARRADLITALLGL